MKISIIVWEIWTLSPSLLTKNASFLKMSLKINIFFHKNKTFLDTLLIIGRYTTYMCHNIMVIFHKDIYNSLGDMDSQMSKENYHPKGQKTQIWWFWCEIAWGGGSYIQIYINYLVMILFSKLFSIQKWFSCFTFEQFVFDWWVINKVICLYLAH